MFLERGLTFLRSTRQSIYHKVSFMQGYGKDKVVEREIKIWPKADY